MAQYGFYFDNSRCTGCRTCTMACKDYKDLGQSIALRKVYDYEGGCVEEGPDGAVVSTAFAYHVSVACNHCQNPACVEACPTGAMKKDPETGLVSNDLEVCIGCGACALACPYGAPVIDSEAMKSLKCDGCAARLAEGKNPVCVDACPLRALEFGPIDELIAAHPGCDADIAPLCDPGQTVPSLIVNKCPAAEASDQATGIVTNIMEIVGVGARSIFNEYSIA